MDDIIKKIKPFVKKHYILMLFIFGIILVLLSFIPKNSTNAVKVDFEDYDYVGVLENKISKIVSMIDGAGDCAVIINITSTSESVYVKENKKSNTSD